MDNDINKPIIKEATIVQGCSTGHHLFSSDKAVLGARNGVLEIRMKCTLCGIEISSLVPELESSLPPDSFPKDDGIVPEQTLERNMPLEDREKELEPKMKSEDPMEKIRQRPFAEPSWANEIRDKYKRDQRLDNFWRDVWDMATRK